MRQQPTLSHGFGRATVNLIFNGVFRMGFDMTTQMHFFVLEPFPKGRQETARTDFQIAEGFKVGNGTRCSKCRAPTGILPWLPPFKVEIEAWGKEFGDFAFSPDILTSKRFLDLFERNRLRGLENRGPVEVLRVTSHKRITGERPEYLKVDVAQSQTAVDQDASGFVWDEKPVCPVCRLGGILKRFSRIVIEPCSWSGEDIFIARGLPGTYITSARFKTVCEVNGVKNSIFIPVEEYEHDSHPSESKILLRNLRIYEDRAEDRESRKDAYRTLAFGLYKDRNRVPLNDFDPDSEIDPAVVEGIRRRLHKEGLLQ